MIFKTQSGKQVNTNQSLAVYKATSEEYNRLFDGWTAQDHIDAMSINSVIGGSKQSRNADVHMIRAGLSYSDVNFKAKWTLGKKLTEGK